MVFGKLTAKLAWGIESRIDVTAHAFLSGSHVRDKLREGHLSHHQHVHIAVTSNSPFRHRAVKESNVDTARQPHERGTKGIDHAYGLDQQPLQLWEERRLTIRLVEYLVASDLTHDDSRIRQSFELPLHGTTARANMTHHFSQIKPLVGAAKE